MSGSQGIKLTCDRCSGCERWQGGCYGACSCAVPRMLFAILVDEGPTGEPRLSSHFFPVVLWVFDDFAWTCARNSLIFAIVVSVSSLVVGVGLQAALCRLPHWGRSILGAAVLTVVAASPAFLRWA